MGSHSNRSHATLSASGASRWIACTPSARMEENIEENNSVYAEEGTLAHELADADLRIKTFVGPKAEKDKLIEARKKLTKKELYDPEMESYVEFYVNYVLEKWFEIKKKNGSANLYIEERADFSYLVPGGFGTSDANIVSDETLHVIDFKYGKGVKVSSNKNAQTRLYALGVLRKYQILYDITHVCLTIVQPRLDHIDSETLSVGKLIVWAEEVVRPAAKKADKGEGEAVPGDWCRWCNAKPVCRALAEKNLELAKHEFADPKTLSNSELSDIYAKLDQFNMWVKALSEYVLKEALAGKKFKGFKLVEGRSNRKWKDEQAVLTRILSEKDEISKEDLTNTKIKGLGDIEKILGKELFNSLLSDLIIKPAGAPTLVPEEDKRPALGIEQAKKDFQ